MDILLTLLSEFMENHYMGAYNEILKNALRGNVFQHVIGTLALIIGRADENDWELIESR